LLPEICSTTRASCSGRKKIAAPQSGNLYRRKMSGNDVGSSMQNIRRSAKKERAEAIPGAHAQHQCNIRTYRGAMVSRLQDDPSADVAQTDQVEPEF